jgi:hypothetical protein
MKKEMQKNIIRTITILFGLIFLSNFISAANIGISPAKIKFEDVLRGGYAERVVTVTIDTDQPTTVRMQTRGNISEWLKFEEMEFEVSKNNPYNIKIVVEPPEDIPNGEYTGFLRVMIDGQGELVEGYATGIINAALDLAITVEVTDIEYLSCRANNFKVESIEEGDPILVMAKVRNDGNIRFRPTIKVDIWDEDQLQIIKQAEVSGKEIIPTTQEEVLVEIDSSDLDLGQYWIDVYSVECYSSEALTFDVLEIGALKANLVLTDIVTEPWVEKDDTTFIKVFYSNVGEKSVRAQFKGEITLNGKIIQILESENSLVGIGEGGDFGFYFTPRENGKYLVNGRIFYDGKRTFEKAGIINVIESGFKIKKLLKPAAYVIVIIGIAYLLYIIQKEKKSMNKKIRRLPHA